MHNPKFIEAYNNINDFVKTKTISEVENFHNETLKRIDNYIDLYKKWKLKISKIDDKLDLFNTTAKLHKEIELELSIDKDRMDQNFHFNLYQELKNKIEENINDFEIELILKQEPIHFKVSKEESKNNQILKKIKNISFSVSSRTFHLFKGKEKKYNWNRIIPSKNLATHYLLYKYLGKVLNNSENYIELLGIGFNNLLMEQKDIDRIFTHTHMPFIKDENELTIDGTYTAFIDKITQFKNELSTERDNFIELLISDLQKLFESCMTDFNIVGTIELPRFNFRSKNILKEINSQNQKVEKSKSNYKNFISSIYDRKEYYEDLQWYTSLLIGNSFIIKNYGDSFIYESIRPTIASIKTELENSIKKLRGNPNNLAEMIEKEKEHLRNSLDHNLLPSLINIIASNKFQKVLEEYSDKLKQNLNEFEKEYTFVKPKNLKYRLKSDQLKQFSPKEIISPIVIKKLNASIIIIMKNFESKISKLNTTIISLGRIVEFNLDSAKVKYKDDASSMEESINIAVDGLLRANNKSEDFYNEVKNSFEEVSISIQTSIKILLEDLVSLFNIDQLLTIKIQVSKEKAVQEVKANFQSAFNKVVLWARWLKIKSVNLFTASKEKIVGISSKVGLNSPQMELSEAMADYLVRVSESLEKLPYVYQRLFSNLQLQDKRIFIGREQEIAKLTKAITYWSNNQISSVMLIGEKGSGTSSLVNIAIQNHSQSIKVYRKEISGTIYKEEDLLKLLLNILKLDNVKNFDELIETLNNSNESTIIIIENIEDFFLRIVDGFKAINKLLEIITSTNTKVLWITTCNNFSWQYLKKVINIDDYFIFNIHLEELDHNIIEEIILSRHHISGYDLVFIPTPEIEKQKSFIKMDDKEKQKYLKDNYFENLKILTSNNIAVALFLWLRSIAEADEEKIQVSTKLELDFSFLNKLSNPKLFSLMAIILHDGVSYEEHSLIFNMSQKSSQMLLATLSDDGIIFRKGDSYKVNFQLYKPIINLLKDKNILH